MASERDEWAPPPAAKPPAGAPPALGPQAAAPQQPRRRFSGQQLAPSVAGAVAEAGKSLSTAEAVTAAAKAEAGTSLSAQEEENAAQTQREGVTSEADGDSSALFWASLAGDDSSASGNDQGEVAHVDAAAGVSTPHIEIRLQSPSLAIGEPKTNAKGDKASQSCPLYWKVQSTPEEKRANVAVEWSTVRWVATVKTQGIDCAEEEAAAKAARVVEVRIPVLVNNKEIAEGDTIKYFAPQEQKKRPSRSRSRKRRC